ncbi:hypothetical protein EVAR_102619_1 [Eumeta japonica]|uniref:Uncharacterized protein n=1 Tax=Eumeta variegata TaxID=151549 RepID=A0A4C1TUT9_EUMVA|nr:hypothetical protein EVAR_102619_1 [Eumeta japonica]
MMGFVHPRNSRHRPARTADTPPAPAHRCGFGRVYGALWFGAPNKRASMVIDPLQDVTNVNKDVGVDSPLKASVRINARNSAAPNCLRMVRCAGSTLPDPSFFSPAFLFNAVATLCLQTSQRQTYVRCSIRGSVYNDG